MANRFFYLQAQFEKSAKEYKIKGFYSITILSRILLTSGGVKEAVAAVRPKC